MNLPPLPRFPGTLPILIAVAVTVAGCEGSNLFQAPIVQPPTSEPEPGPDPVLRYFEEGTLLIADDEQLRFRWQSAGPIGLEFHPGTPGREAQAIERAVGLIAPAGTPEVRRVGFDGEIVVRTLSPDEYRKVDPDRPWSFSRTAVTATREGGISEVEIVLSLGLDQPTLERAALHAIGHAMGIMGHPGFPGDRYVMAARPEEGSPPPTVPGPVELDAFEFLYSPGVSAGMTREELRAAFETWSR